MNKVGEKVEIEGNWNPKILKTYLEAKGKRKATVEKYLENFARIPHTLPLDVKAINDWQMQSKYAISSKHAISCVIRNYFKALGRKKEVSDIECIYYKSEEFDKYITEEENKKMMGSKKITRQLQILINIYFYSGLRRSIPLNLNPQMLDKQRKGINVGAKIPGNKAGVLFFVPLPYWLFDEIIQHIADENIGINDRIFQIKKTNGQLYKDEERALTKKIKTIATSVGLPNWMSPHKLRHSYGTYYIESGGRKEVLQKNLGQKYGTSTERYAHMRSITQRKEFDEIFGKEKKAENSKQ